MTYAKHTLDIDFETLLRFPGWITAPGAQNLEDVAFQSGAVLAALSQVLRVDRVPVGLLRDRMALRAAEAMLRYQGRPERLSDLRDEVHLARPGDRLGPGGAMATRWRRFVRRNAIPDGMSDEIASDVFKRLVDETGAMNPVASAASAIEVTRRLIPRDAAAAIMIGDLVLSRALGWSSPVPVLSLGPVARILNETGRDLSIACHRAVISAGPDLARQAQDLWRRAERLKSVAAQLRAKGAGAALGLFLSQDALSPTVALSPVIRGTVLTMSDRAARRLCDRLVSLGVVRELTGRDMFRLYGL